MKMPIATTQLCFYRNTEGNLVYINWLRRGHYYHIMGDVINYSELVLMNNQVVFYRNWGYSFVNPQWHLEDYPNETKVQVAESIRDIIQQMELR
jgi:hypothetical protein